MPKNKTKTKNKQTSQQKQKPKQKTIVSKYAAFAAARQRAKCGLYQETFDDDTFTDYFRSKQEKNF